MNEEQALPKVSILIPVFNGEKYIEDALQSAWDQSYPHKEIIVINDGSTDGTERLLKRSSYPLILINQQNRGLGAARNAGIKRASGELIAFLDVDDLWTIEKLSKQVEFYLKKKEDPLIFTAVEQFICPTLKPAEQKKIHIENRQLPGYIASSLLLSQQRFEEVGPFFEKKEVGEFIDWYLRAIEKQLPIYCLPEVHLYRRIHDKNMGREKERYDRKAYLHILKSSIERRRYAKTVSQ